MLTKILLVATFILLSWNSLEFSKNNTLLRLEIEKLTLNDESIENHVMDIETILNSHSKSLNEQLSLLNNNQDKFEKLSKNEKQTASLSHLKKSIDKVNSSVGNIKKSLDKQAKTILENKNNISEIKKTTYRISDLIKKQATLLTQYQDKSNTVTVEKVVTKQLNKPVIKNKSGVIKTKKPSAIISESNPFYRMAIALNRTKELHKNEKMEQALEQLSKLKSEVWKSRKVENIPTELVMSILSSIDITKAKWDNKEFTYNTDNIEKKIKQLFIKLGVVK